MRPLEWQKTQGGNVRYWGGGGVELPQGIDTPGVAELLRGDETPRVTTKGEGVPEDDGRGRGEDRNPPTTRATEARGAGGSDEERMGSLRTAPPPHPQRGTEADTDSVGTLPRHTSGTNGFRPEHGALARRKYGLLVPTGTAVDPANTGYKGSGDGHEATRRTFDQAQRETEEGGRTRQRGMLGDEDKERRPPERSRALNTCSRQGG